MLPSTSYQQANPAFISTPFPSPSSYSARAHHRRCKITCSATRDDSKDGSKRDPIAEWVARARSQGHARRARGSTNSNTSNPSSNRAGAASALDAVDRLFGGNDSAGTDDPPLRYSGQGQPVSDEQRKQWIDDLRRSGSRPRHQSIDDDIQIDSPGPVKRGSSDQRKISRLRGRRKSSAQQSVEEDLNSGFSEANIYDDDDYDDNTGATVSPRVLRSSRQRSTIKRTPRRRTGPINRNVMDDQNDDDDENAASSLRSTRSTRTRTSKRRTRRPEPRTSSGTNTMNASFTRLLEIARSGGTANNSRSQKPDFDSMQDALSDVATTYSTPDRRRKGARSPSGNSRSSKKSTDAPIQQLLEMSQNPSSGGTRKALFFDDEILDGDEESFDNGNTVLRSIGIKVPDKQETRRKYVATRRVGGRQRKILSPPAEWAPMTDDEIAKVRSDKTPLISRRSIGAEPVQDCTECYATGLEMCSVCVGTGWVEPLRKRRKGSKETKHDAQVRQVWERPNLCIHKDGSAQCPCCNGIGKSLCSHCEGSGSALRKGFDPADKYVAFDMFQGGSTPPFSDEDFEYIDGDEGDDVEVVSVHEDDVKEVADEDEEDMIYAGTANGFEFSLPHMEQSTFELSNSTSPTDNQYEEKEFEFSNGVYDEEYTDFASKPQRRPLLKRVKEFKDDYIPFSDYDQDAEDEERFVKSKATQGSENLAIDSEDADEDGEELESRVIDTDVTNDVLDDDDDDLLEEDGDIDDAELEDELELEEDAELVDEDEDVDEDDDDTDLELESVLPLFDDDHEIELAEVEVDDADDFVER